MANPSIVWTDEIGAAALVCAGLTFNNWTPDVTDVGESVVPVGNSRTFFFAYRQDYIAAFDIANIANSELGLAMRLKSWLVRGGVVTINTQDSASRVYTSYVAPGTVPKLAFSDSTELEYTLSLVVVNNTAEEPLLYTPTLHGRAASLVLSPSPLSLPYPGSGADVTATVLGALGGPLAGVGVTASSSSPGAFTVTASAVTNGSGVATFHITPNAGGTGTLTVRAGALSATDTVSVLPGVYGVSSPAPILWLKAETENATADGAAVTTWHDQSPHGWDMTVKTGGSVTPKWDATKQAIQFHSSGPEAYENLSFNSLQAGVSGFTLFIVAQEATNGGTMMSASDYTFWDGYTTAGRYRMDLNSFGYNAYFSYADLLKHLHETRYDGAQSTQAARTKQYMDGTLESSTYYSIASTLTSGPGMEIGHGQGLGNLSGWIWEILMFGVRLSDADCDMVQTALRAKYSI